MYARATTTISILRGEDTDEWGDPIDTATPVETGVPASIIEYKTYNKGEITTQPRNIRYARLRVKSTTDVREDDRIKDERSDEIWVIINISKLQSPVIGQDYRIDLQFVGTVQ